MSSNENSVIAVTGLACRFPGAPDAGAFWQLLIDGGDAVEPMPEDRFPTALFDATSPGSPGGVAVRRGGFLTEVDKFDANFFEISRREADVIDPQHRILLETAWEAVEDAGLTRADLAGSRTGVFVAQWTGDYERLVAPSSADVDLDVFAATGTGRYAAAGRISYAFDLRGSSLVVDTACSSSLVALHLACQSLRTGECDLALVGAVNLILDPLVSIAYSRSGLLSRDGCCRFGDQAASGYVRSEGVGVVVLKPARTAARDGDRIRALVLGTATNNDGGGSGSLAAPSTASQAAMLRAAQLSAGIEPEDIQYIEAHGTGTAVGDPVEMAAIVAASGDRREHPCLVGSVKSNIGHTESAAGMAGLIKTILSLEHGLVPPTIHFQHLNPDIDLRQRVELCAAPARLRGNAAIAAVSAFGITGTNAHVILQQGPATAARQADAGTPCLVPLSAPSDDALAATIGRWRHQDWGEVAFHDAAYTAAVRRTHHQRRRAFVADRFDELRVQLATPPSRPGPHHLAASVVFVFPGQGSQWLGMGRQLYATDAVAREALRECDRALAPFWRRSAIDLLTGKESADLEDTAVIQPLLFALQVMLARVWNAWGVEPTACIGHSMGEVAAAHIGGALTLEDAARVICARSALLTRTRGRGAMALIEATESEAAELIRDDEAMVSLAAVNDSRSTVISGNPQTVDRILAQVESRGRFGRRINVDVASHSPSVDSLVDPLVGMLRDVTPSTTARRVYSTVSERHEQPVVDAAYWGRNLRAPVRFESACRAALADGHCVFVEVSAHPILTQSIARIAADAEIDATIVGSLRRGEDECRALLRSAGDLYEAGVDLAWKALFASPGQVVALPGQHWQRERFWTDRRGDVPANRRSHGRVSVAAADVPGRSYWSTRIGTESHPALRDHRVLGQSVVPAAFFLALATESTGETSSSGVRLKMHEALAVDDDRELEVVVDGTPNRPTRQRFYSRATAEDASSWTLHCTIEAVSPEAEKFDKRMPPALDSAAAAEDAYTVLGRRGLEYGPLFRRVVEWRRSDGLVSARLQGATHREGLAAWVPQVTLIDACLQAVVLSVIGESAGDTWLPTDIQQVRILDRPSDGEDLFCRVSDAAPAGDDDDRWSADVVLTTGDARVLLIASGVTLVRVNRRSIADSLLHAIVWQPHDLDAQSSTARDSRAQAIVFDDEAGTGMALVADPSHEAAIVRLTGTERDGVAALLDRLSATVDQPFEIVHAWNLDVGTPSTSGEFAQARTLGLTSLLHAVRAIATHPAGGRLTIVTRGAQQVTGNDDVRPAQALAWGLASVIRAEYPSLACVTLDLDPGGETSLGRARAVVKTCRRSETLALRGDRLMAGRLERVAVASPSEDDLRPWSGEPVRFSIRTPGDLDSLLPSRLARREPRAGEVEIEVARTALNFMNVMLAFGREVSFGSGAGSLGIECVGRIVRCGEQTEYSPGDRVLAYAVDSLATHVTTDARLVARASAHLSSDAAATLPVAFVTAFYALIRLAHLRPGERVLIHSAAGGVGLAAIQVARFAGAEVLATAGTEEKRNYLRSAGIAHVFDSRTTSFAALVREATGGTGVDVVLNSLAGEAIDAGLAALAPCGRFLELGKRDILENRPVSLGAFRANISYHAVDIDALARERPALVGGILRDVIGLVVQGTFTPLPYRVFAAAEARRAFATMASGRQVGKLLIDMSDRAGLLVRTPAARRDWSTGTFLITGGFGALGLCVARWLTHEGARSLVLVGRRAPDLDARAHIAAIEALGASVRCVQADISDRDAVVDLLRQTRARRRPLRGVFHAAGILDDALIESLDDAQLHRAMAGKVEGAWHLHELTRGDDLDLFVAFSSVSAFIGSAGQANYAAANAFLDALAHRRRREGLPALSVQWGPWADRGLAAADPARGARLADLGLDSLTPEAGIAALDRLLPTKTAVIAAMRFDVRRWRRSAPGATSNPIFAALGDVDRALSAEHNAFKSEVAAATPAVRRALLEQCVAAALAGVLRAAPEQIAVTAPFRSLGLDSLMTLEFRRRLEAATGLALTTTIVWNHPTVSALAVYLADRLSPVDQGPVAAGGSADADQLESILAEVEGLTDAEVEQLSLSRSAEGGDERV